MSIQHDQSLPARNNVQVGDPAPGFTLPALTGQLVSLASFLGKKNIVLYFYPRDDWTPVKIGV